MTVTVTILGESVEYASPFEAVLAILPLCRAVELGRLKTWHLTRLQVAMGGREVAPQLPDGPKGLPAVD